ncbi:hypothetical protein AAF712_013503 [Marasmius tenuissimus]|uniref:Uncharacterized protein n=1 Tax=Marasmius tenuissimus TaxID=585030 RepID=A0ABR2ZEJ9_9AGAR
MNNQAFIPGGSDSFVLPSPPVDADSFTWTANISAQTEVAFWAIDSQNRRGGISELKPVGSSSDTSCLVPKAASTGSSSSGTGTTTFTSSNPGISQPSGSETDRTEGKKGLSTGEIVGIAVGVGVAIPALLALLWYRRRQRRSSQDQQYPTYAPSDSPYGPRTSVYRSLPLQSPPMRYVAEPFNPPGGIYSQNPHSSDPFTASPSQNYQQYPETSYHGYNPGGEAPSTSSAIGGATSNGHPQYVVHQDAAEAMVNLPPHYRDRRDPITMSYPGNVGSFPNQGGDQKTG